MKTKNYLIIVSTSILLILFTISTATYGEAKSRLDLRLEMLKKELNLSDKQTKKIKQIFLSTKEQQENIRKNNSADRPKVRQKIKEIFQIQDNKIEALLTQEQKEHYQQIRIRSNSNRNNPKK
jgi:hypothetical protein